VDDDSGEPLVQREDDQEATVRDRLNVYHTQTEQLVGYYESTTGGTGYHRVDGVGQVDDIRQRIVAALG